MHVHPRNVILPHFACIDRRAPSRYGNIRQRKMGGPTLRHGKNQYDFGHSDCLRI